MNIGSIGSVLLGRVAEQEGFAQDYSCTDRGKRAGVPVAESKPATEATPKPAEAKPADEVCTIIDAKTACELLYDISNLALCQEVKQHNRACYDLRLRTAKQKECDTAKAREKALCTPPPIHSSLPGRVAENPDRANEACFKAYQESQRICGELKK